MGWLQWDKKAKSTGYSGTQRLDGLLIMGQRVLISWDRETRSPMYWSQWEGGAKSTCSSWNQVTERTVSSGTERLNRLVTVDWLYWDKEAKWICSSGTYGLDVNGYSGKKRLIVLVMGEEAQCTGYSKKEKQQGLIKGRVTAGQTG